MSTRTRTARLSALAGAVLLALPACGGTDESASTEQPPAVSDAGGVDLPGAEGSDGGGDDSSGVGSTETADSEGEASDGGGDDQDPMVEDSLLLALVARDVAPDEAGDPVVSSDALSSILASTYEADGGELLTTCHDDLRQEKDGYAVCFAQIGDEPEMEWVAHPLWFPSPDGGEASTGVLFLHDAAPTQQDLDAIGPDFRVVVGGRGSMYGVDAPIPAQQLGTDALDTLELDPNAPEFSSITCEDDLTMEMFTAVACSAQKAGGGTVTVNVLPAPLQNSERGLMVSYPADQAQAG